MRDNSLPGIILLVILLTMGFLLVCSSANADTWFEDFEGGIPADWLTEDYYPGSEFMWTTEDIGGRGNNTGGSGLFVIGDSENYFGGYDIGLLTPEFYVEPNSVFIFDTDYQRWIDDPAEVDITLDGGSSWINLLSWSIKHEGPEHVEVLLQDYTGEDARLRFHYSHRYGFAWNKWWEIDNVGIIVIPSPAAYLILIAACGFIALRRLR